MSKGPTSFEQGDEQGAAQLLVVVYDELRRLARQKLAREQSGQTLDATALVHEVYLRLVVGKRGAARFDNQRHFFAAAAEAMRRILVERARARQARKRGGDGQRLDLDFEQLTSRYSDAELTDTHLLLDNLAQVDAAAAELVRLHVFGGLSLEEAGALLGMSRASAYRDWSFARAWLRDALSAAEKTSGP